MTHACQDRKMHIGISLQQRLTRSRTCDKPSGWHFSCNSPDAKINRANTIHLKQKRCDDTTTGVHAASQAHAHYYTLTTSYGVPGQGNLTTSFDVQIRQRLNVLESRRGPALGQRQQAGLPTPTTVFFLDGVLLQAYCSV